MSTAFKLQAKITTEMASECKFCQLCMIIGSNVKHVIGMNAFDYFCYLKHVIYLEYPVLSCLEKGTAYPDDVVKMEAFSTLLALCVGNSPVTGEFPTQRPVMWSFHVLFDLCLNKPLRKQSRGQWFEMPSCSLWCHCNTSSKMHTLLLCFVLSSDYSISYVFIPVIHLTIFFKIDLLALG